MSELELVCCPKTALILLLCCHQLISQDPFHLWILSLQNWVRSVKLFWEYICEDRSTKKIEQHHPV